MFFVAIISDYKEFELLSKKICNNKNKITLININKESIVNLKNVKFDTIVIMDSIEDLEEKEIYLEEMCKDIKYLIINSDITIKTKNLSNIKSDIITLGSNNNATVTFSSIKDENLLISVQRGFKNKNDELIEIGEYVYEINMNDREHIYEILVEFIIKNIYKLE